MVQAVQQTNFLEIDTACQQPVRGLVAVDGATRRWLRCPCKRWLCKGCGKYKTRQVAKRFELMGPTHLITVTLAERLGDAFAKLCLKRLRFWCKRNRLYDSCGWVREYGKKTGRLHFHLLVRSRRQWLPFAQLQAASRRNYLGNIDVKRVGKSAARYVAKYLAKDLSDNTESPRRSRRYFCPIPPPKRVKKFKVFKSVPYTPLANCVLVGTTGEVFGVLACPLSSVP